MPVTYHSNAFIVRIATVVSLTPVWACQRTFTTSACKFRTRALW